VYILVNGRGRKLGILYCPLTVHGYELEQSLWSVLDIVTRKMLR